ncbi:MAG: hypothetical protein ACYTAF_14460, partial [Planctomycetota bacterium]
MRIALTLTALLIAAGTAAAQQDDVIQLKSGPGQEPQILVGKVIKITDTTVEFQHKKKGKMSLAIEDIEPYSLYRLKAARIDDASGKEHFELGEWCFSAGLYTTALREFERAKLLDRKIAGKCDERIRASREED